MEIKPCDFQGGLKKGNKIMKNESDRQEEASEVTSKEMGISVSLDLSKLGEEQREEVEEVETGLPLTGEKNNSEEEEEDFKANKQSEKEKNSKWEEELEQNEKEMEFCPPQRLSHLRLENDDTWEIINWEKEQPVNGEGKWHEHPDWKWALTDLKPVDWEYENGNNQSREVIQESVQPQTLSSESKTSVTETKETYLITNNNNDNINNNNNNSSNNNNSNNNNGSSPGANLENGKEEEEGKNSKDDEDNDKKEKNEKDEEQEGEESETEDIENKVTRISFAAVKMTIPKLTEKDLLDVEDEISEITEKSNRVQSMVKSTLMFIIEGSFSIGLLFLLIALATGIASFQTKDWLINRIKYTKGQIEGVTLTKVGMSGVQRVDTAYLEDGAELRLKRNLVTFNDILEKGENVRKLRDESEKGKESEEQGEKVDKTEGEDGGNDDGDNNNDNKKGKEEEKKETKIEQQEGQGQQEEKDKKVEKEKEETLTKEVEEAERQEERDEKGKKKKKSKRRHIRGLDIEVEDRSRREGEVEMEAEESNLIKKCGREREFIRKSSCFRDMCEIGTLNKKRTKYYKTLYGPTIYDINYKEYSNLKEGAKYLYIFLIIEMVLLSLGIYSYCLNLIFESCMNVVPVIMNYPKSCRLIWMAVGMVAGGTGFAIWKSYTGGPVCVDAEGVARACNYGTGVRLYWTQMTFYGLGLFLWMIDYLWYG